MDSEELRTRVERQLLDAIDGGETHIATCQAALKPFAG